VIAGSVAALLLGGILVSLSAVTYAIGFAGRPPAAPTPTDVRERLMWLTLGASILSILFGLTLKFVNNSSHQALYGARLTRAYLGASNKRRYDDKDARKVSDPVEGDDIGWGQYAPFRNGGPLHIVNVTLNETISGESQVEQRDRRGIPMAIGPCGLSGSKRSHSLFKQEGDPPTSADPGSDRSGLPQGVSDWIKPVSGAGSDEFDLFFGSPPREHVVEALNLGTWVAISGAAFTTGLGAQTSLSLSLLLGIANVRLGYWWDSHVEPWARNPVRAKPDLAKQVGEVVNAVFPVQMHLVQEFTARFFGPHRRRWYLSDGGHFENTACYELIRRRVPFIIACDNGQDESFAFEDIANLVRKVRIDFCAEVRFLTREEINEHVDPSLHDAIGTLDDFRMPLADANERGLRRDISKAHALLAWVYYEVGYEQGGRPGSVILFIKPSVTGDEPLDVLQYRHQNPAFPNESTMDQYFDEAQWESYRKLGAHIGHVLFGRATTGAAWRPALMRAPLEAVEPRGHAERTQEPVGSSRNL
jgi:hypothetical protein